MTLATVTARIAEIETALQPPQAARPATVPPSPSPSASFSAVLGQAALSSSVPLGRGGAGALAAAAGEVGQAEQPPGSNDSPRIAEYRSAVPGGPVGPWCAYFVSWAAQQAGVPLGDRGEGFASVDALYAWAQSSGRAVPVAAGPPSPGDLIVWDEHVGIVESVLPDGTIKTIEGNSSDQVARRTYPAGGGGAIGYVRLG